MTDEIAEEIKRKKLQALKQRATGAPDTPIEIESRSQLQAVLDKHPIVLVDCQADWCGPCQQLEPILAQVANQTAAAVATVDIEQHPDLAREWSVRSVPTVLLYTNGELRERIMGVRPFDRFDALIDRYT